MLAAAAILPLALMAGLGLVVLWRQQGQQAERVGLELARSVANAIDSELRNSMVALETVATSGMLDTGDLEGFRRRALRLVDANPDWLAVVLEQADGRLLVDTRVPLGGASPPALDPESFERVVRTGRPVVGGLAHAADAGWLFAVRVPVPPNGEPVHVLTALVRPAAILSALTRQQVPPDWVISIVDANGLRVARSRAHVENLGGRLSPTAQQVVDAGGMEGFGVSYALEGDRIFTPYSRLPMSGWIAVLGFPTALADAAAYRSLAVYGGGVMLSVALGTLVALGIARSVTRPMADLRQAAEALGRRERPSAPDTSIQEIRDVAMALQAAAEALRQGEAERERLLRSERQARATAEAADRAKDEFMAVLSHELRTPLNAVFGWARLLQGSQAGDDELVARAQDAIVRNAKVQVQLIDDLLDMARITSGKMRLDIGTIRLHAVLHDALDAVRPAAEAKGLRIDTALDAEADRVRGDAARLQQVVWNLLMNAVKFTPRGGWIRLGLDRGTSSVQITVADSGRGIAPDVLPHVFERFRQGDSSSTRAHGGLGLGLALVKHLVELHAGSVTADSAGEGGGATFTVTLPTPLADAPDGPSDGAADVPPVAGRRGVVRLDGLRVVVVDDDRETLALMEAIVSGAGGEVLACQAADEALAAVERWRPDVLVSDIEMPGEDGCDLIARIRALPPEGGGQTPAVALTAYGRPADRRRSIAAGFTRHAEKPVDPGELTALIATVGRPSRPE